MPQPIKEHIEELHKLTQQEFSEPDMGSATMFAEQLHMALWAWNYHTQGLVKDATPLLHSHDEDSDCPKWLQELQFIKGRVIFDVTYPGGNDKMFCVDESVYVWVKTDNYNGGIPHYYYYLPR